jgi:sugar O-acyltransferase (sialic acid O-acetyltransferase NeuD family)
MQQLPRECEDELMARPIVLWGATGQAKVLSEFLGKLDYEIVAIFDNNVSLTPPIPDVPLLFGWDGFRRWRDDLGLRECGFLVAIGGGLASGRLEIFERLEAAGLKPGTAVHPAAYVAKSARVGAGSQILAGAVVGTETTLGRTTIVNTKASVDHECTIGDAVHIAPGATLCGCVRLAEGVFVGAGAVILPRIQVGERAVVGAGAVVTKDVPPRAVVKGIPARVSHYVE